jgi:hypothetical protein
MVTLEVMAAGARAISASSIASQVRHLSLDTPRHPLGYGCPGVSRA